MRFVLIVLVMLWSVNLFAEDAKWEKSADANLNLTQNAYSDSWSGGEVGSITWLFNSNAMAQKQVSAKLHSKTTLKLSFGQTHNQDAATKKWAAPVKSTDLVDLESVLRMTLGIMVDPFVSGRLESQFLDTRNPANMPVFNPMIFSEALGVARNLIKKDKREWTARLGGALRQNVDRNVPDVTSPGDYTTSTTNDGGLEFVTQFVSPIAGERIKYDTKLSVFKALFNSKSDELPTEDWKAVDANWEHIFTAAIAKYLAVNLYVQMLYDKEIDKRVRIKETLALTLTYKLL